MPEGFLGTSPSFKGGRNYARELQKTITTQGMLAPGQEEIESRLAPFATARTLGNLQDFLLGTGEMSMPTYHYTPPVKPDDDDGSFFDDFFDPINQLTGGASMLFGGGSSDGNRGPGRKENWSTNGTFTRGPQRGFLSIFEDDIIPSQLRAQTSLREGDIRDVGNLGPQAREAMRRSNPQVAALLDMLDASAKEDLAAGTNVSGADLRRIQQHGRAGASARGMGLGPIDNFEEALNSLNYGKTQQDRARSFAGSVMAQNEGFYGDPFERILNRNASAGQGAQNQSSQALLASKVANFLNPESEYASGVYGSNAAGVQSAENSRASANSALVAGIMSMIGNAAGGAAGGI